MKSYAIITSTWKTYRWSHIFCFFPSKRRIYNILCSYVWNISQVVLFLLYNRLCNFFTQTRVRLHKSILTGANRQSIHISIEFLVHDCVRICSMNVRRGSCGKLPILDRNEMLDVWCVGLRGKLGNRLTHNIIHWYFFYFFFTFSIGNVARRCTSFCLFPDIFSVWYILRVLCR